MLKNFIILLVLIVIPLTSIARADNLKLKKLESHHYQIYTNLPEDSVQPFAVHLDAIYDDYSQRFSHFNSNPSSSKLMNLFLLATESDFIKFMASHNIKAKNSGGMFFIQPHIQGLATWVLGRSKFRTFSVLQHEGFHQFAFNYIGVNLPIWVNEGMAQYYQDGIMVNDYIKLGLIDIPRFRLIKTAIKNNRFVQLKKMVGLTDKRWKDILNSNPQTSNILYAQAWSMVYFLTYADNGQYKQEFIKYLHLVANGEKGKAAFKIAFGTDNFDAVQKQWINYVTNQKPSNMSMALNRLRFLGEGIKYLITHKNKKIYSIAQLRRQLHGFYLVRKIEGLKIKQKTKNKMFRYLKDNGNTATFKMIESNERNLPPTLTAPGLNPQPVLIWSRDKRGNLEQNIEFR